MKTMSTLPLLLFLAILGHSVASIMVRREAEEAASPEDDVAANETEVMEAEESTETEAKESTDTEAEESTEIEAKESTDTEAEESTDTEAEESTDTEASAAEAGITTEEEAKETEETETEDEEKATEEGIFDEDEEGNSSFPDIGFQTGIVFGSPFVTLTEMQRYFFELERALHRVFEQTLNEAAENPDSNSTTTEEVSVGGHKYLVNRTVLKGGDEDSSVVIKAITIVPTEERRKRALAGWV